MRDLGKGEKEEVRVVIDRDLVGNEEGDRERVRSAIRRRQYLTKSENERSSAIAAKPTCWRPRR